MSKCRWALDADPWNGDSWDTECGQKHIFTVDGPEENFHKFCPYCGGELVTDLTRRET